MPIKHSTVHNPNEIVPSADWNANHTGTAEPDAHAIDGVKHTGDITDAQHGVRTLANAHSHANLSNVTANDHHAQSHTLASHSTKAHAELTNVTSDQHHAQSHTLASHSTKAHAELTNVTSDQHHAQSHNAASHSDIASTGAQIDDAVSKKHTQNTDTALGAQSQNLNMNTHKIVGVVDPTANQEAATKKYVDDKVAIVKGTHYWSCAGTHFNTENPDVDDVVYYFGSLIITGSTNFIIAQVNLPAGATITNVIVYGNAATEDTIWEMRRVATATGGVGTVMATQNVNTADATITNPIVDNATYSYILFVDALSAADQIHGARITYTL